MTFGLAGFMAGLLAVALGTSCGAPSTGGTGGGNGAQMGTGGGGQSSNQGGGAGGGGATSAGGGSGGGGATNTGGGTGGGSASAPAVVGDTRPIKAIWGATENDYQAGGRKLIRIDPATGRDTTLFVYGEEIEDLDFYDGLVYFTAQDNSINALDPATQKLVWEAPAGTRYESTSLADPWVRCSGGVCFTASGLEGLLVAYDAKTGAALWSTDLRSPNVHLKLIDTEYVYIVTHEGREYPNFVMQIRRSTGELVWRRRLPDARTGTGAPTLLGTDKLLVPANDLYCFDLATGAVVWSYPMGESTYGASTVVFDNGRLFFQGSEAVAEGFLYAIDPADGHLLWKVKAGNDYAGVVAPRVYGDLVIGTTVNSSSLSLASLRRLFVVNAATGARIPTFNDKDVLSGSPTLNNGTFYFFGQIYTGTATVSAGSGYFALDAISGVPRWKHTRATLVKFQY